MTELFPHGGFEAPLVSATDDLLSYFFENDLPFSPLPQSADDRPLDSPLSPVPLFSDGFDALDDTSPEYETEEPPAFDFLSRTAPQTCQPSSPPSIPSPQFSCSPEQQHYQSPHASARSPQFEWAKSTDRSSSATTDDGAKPRIKRERADSSEGKAQSPPSKPCMSVESLSQLGTGVTLPRHVLIKITSEEFEAYAGHLTQLRQLSDEEHKELRRQRRMIKNREYAQENRTKKKKASLTTHQQVAELEKENAVLRGENVVLKQEIIRLRTMLSEVAYNNAEVKAGSILTPPAATRPSVPSSFMSFLSVGKAPVKASAACLFVVLFSFALFNIAPTSSHVDSSDQRSSSARVLLALSQTAVQAADGISSWICSFAFIAETSWCRNDQLLPPPPRPSQSDLSRSSSPQSPFAFDDTIACQ